MTGCFFSCLTRLIRNRRDLRPETIDYRLETGELRHQTRDPGANLKPQASCLQSVVYSLWSIAYAASPQTPVFKGERTDRLKEIKEIASTLLKSEIFFFVILSIAVVIALIFLYNRMKDISQLGVEFVQDDTWFITRDDNNRVGIFVSVNLSNKGTRGVSIVNCKLSGYSAREHPEEIHLVGPEGEQELKFTEHTHFSKEQGFYLGPYTSETLWFYYESRTVTMRNLLEAPLTIRDSDRKRKSIRVRIPRHADQIAIYKEMAKIW